MSKSGFWGSPGGEIVDPKRQFRWLLSFGNANNKIQDWYAKSAKKPSFEVGETEVAFLNHSFYYPGRVKWSTIDVTLVDPAGGPERDTSWNLMDVLMASGYHVPSSKLSASRTITKQEAVDAIGGQILLKQIGRDEFDKIEEWTLHNPWILSVDFGQLDYTSEDMVEISLTLRYDYATLTVGGVQRPLTLV